LALSPTASPTRLKLPRFRVESASGDRKSIAEKEGTVCFGGQRNGLQANLRSIVIADHRVHDNGITGQIDERHARRN